MDKSFSKVVDQILTPFPMHCAGTAESSRLLQCFSCTGITCCSNSTGNSSVVPHSRAHPAPHAPGVLHISPQQCLGSPRHGHTLM